MTSMLRSAGSVLTVKPSSRRRSMGAGSISVFWHAREAVGRAVCGGGEDERERAPELGGAGGEDDGEHLEQAAAECRGHGEAPSSLADAKARRVAAAGDREHFSILARERSGRSRSMRRR